MNIELKSGINLGDIQPTPGNPMFDAEKETPEAFRILVEHGKKLGFPISYIQESAGYLVQNLLPVKKNEGDQISTSSKVELELHTETAFHPYKPDYLLLLCLRGNPEAFTTYALLDDFIDDLSDDHNYILQKNLYSTELDQSFIRPWQPNVQIDLSVLRETDNGWELTFDWHLMKGKTQEAQEALDNVRALIAMNTKKISLKQGDLLIINNNKAVHGRTPFKPKYDGTDRWLQRLMVRRHMPPRAHIHGHAITTQFGS